MLCSPAFYQLRILIIVGMFLIQVDTSPPIVTVDIDKGIILRQLGYYSEKLQQQVFHIFIPINNFCTDFSSSDVCHYLRSSNKDIKVIRAIQSQAAQFASSYDRKAITNIIEKNIRRVLYGREVEKFLGATRSMVYSIDDRFYLPSSLDTTLTPFAHSLSDSKRQSMEYSNTQSASLVLQQIFNQKVGYDFLTNGQIVELLSLIMSNGSPPFDSVNSEENLSTFIDSIIGQSLFVLKSCSIGDKENTRLALPCLAISTLIHKLPLEISSIYQVYQTTPLPVSFEGHQYVYENLPKFFGYNDINKNIIIWTDEEMLSSCSLSKVIQCRFTPSIIKLSSLPCLSDILSTGSSSISHCQVSESKDFQTGVLNVESNLWYFYSSAEPFQCKSTSLTGGNLNITLIRPPMLATFPCNQEIQCSDIKLPVTECTDRTLYLKTANNLTWDEKSLASLSLKNVTERLLSIYQTTVRRNLLKLQMDIAEGRTILEKFFEEFISVIISSITLFILCVGLLVCKRVNGRNVRMVEQLRTTINRVQRDFIDTI